LHELATNTAEHGGLSRAQGRVSVKWAVSDNGKNSVLKFQWCERGGPAVVPPKRQGFGTLLLKAVSAESHFHYAPEGLTCTVELVLPIVAAPTIDPLELSNLAIND
jgi:two-component sensor histidine kinase